MNHKKKGVNTMTHDVQEIQKNTIHIEKAGRSGKVITCLGGTLWITQEGDGVDRILTCGDSYQSMIPGTIVIEGLDHSKIRVSSVHKVQVIGHYQNRIQPQLAFA
jgi:hypothetical protein